MGSLSRYDFFRIVLPGGLVVFLLDACARIILGTPHVRAGILAGFPKFVEQPVIAIAATFGVGLVLYFLDLPYSSPQFWKDIPSTHLETRVTKQQAPDALSLFFWVSDQLMPQELRDRALLYGAIYRIGYMTVFFAVLACLATPFGVILHLRRTRVHSPVLTGPVLVSVVVVGTIILVPFVREGFKTNPRWPSGWLLFFLIPVAASSLLWLNVAYGFLPHRMKEAGWIAGGTILVGLPWAILRLVGPLKPRLQMWRSGGRKPDKPHVDTAISLLDGGAVLVSLLALWALSRELSNTQIAAIATLQGVALILSFLKKHERQLRGIYRNQNNWLDANLDKVLLLANSGSPVPPTPPADATTPVAARASAPPSTFRRALLEWLADRLSR